MRQAARHAAIHGAITHPGPVTFQSEASSDKALPCLKEKFELPFPVMQSSCGGGPAAEQTHCQPSPALGMPKSLGKDKSTLAPHVCLCLPQQVSPPSRSHHGPHRAHSCDSGCGVPAGTKSQLPQLSPTAEKLPWTNQAFLKHCLPCHEAAGTQPPWKRTQSWHWLAQCVCVCVLAGAEPAGVPHAAARQVLLAAVSPDTIL